MGHDHAYRVPPHTEFCSIKGIKELEELEGALAKRGLKDPWIRNEIWRYHPGFGTKLLRFRLTFFRGFGVGAVLTAATLAFDKLAGGGDGHGHGHAADGHH